MSCSANFESEQVERAVVVFFRAVVAHARSQPAAFAQARREFLTLARAVGPTFQHRLISRAAERLVADMPRAASEDAAQAVRHDCIKLFGSDLYWCDLAAVDPWGSA
jgi:hypothetical protein